MSAGGQAGSATNDTLRILLVRSGGAVSEVVSAVAEALAQPGLAVRQVDLGKVPAIRDRGGAWRALQAIWGEGGAHSLERALAEHAPQATVVFEPNAAALLVRERNRRLAALALERSEVETASAALPFPVIAVVAEMAPRSSWNQDADRYAVVDDEAAVVLADSGVDGARVVTTGPPVARDTARAAREAKTAIRAAFSLPSDEQILLVNATSLGRDVLATVVLQLALLRKQTLVLFDAEKNIDAATIIRNQVPGLGLRAKLFGATGDSARLWRASDVVITRPTPAAILRGLASGCALVAIEPHGDQETSEVRSLVDRGLGCEIPRALLLATAIEPWLAGRSSRVATLAAYSRNDAAASVAALVRQVAAQRESILIETLESIGQRAADGTANAGNANANAGTDTGSNTERQQRQRRGSRPAPAPASGLEDLGTLDGDFDERADRGVREPRNGAHSGSVGSRGSRGNRATSDGQQSTNTAAGGRSGPGSNTDRVRPPPNSPQSPQSVEEMLSSLKSRARVQERSVEEALRALKKRMKSE
ncbi:MAG: hypothetical protein V2A73_15270 [Pseudomonadota bacterium]